MGKLSARVQINYLHIEPDASTRNFTQRLNNTGRCWATNGCRGGVEKGIHGGAPFGGLGLRCLG